MSLRRILLTTDFSDCARGAYGTAASLARRFGARLDLVHCVESAVQYSLAAMERIQEAHKAHRSKLEELLGSEAGHPAFTGLAVEHFLLEGFAPDAISEQSLKLNADLIVQASHGRRGFRRWVLGSFAERLLRMASLPVLTLRAGGSAATPALPGFEPRKILVPIDFSPACRAPLDAVRFLATSFGARVYLLHVWSEAATIPAIPGMMGEGVAWASVDAWEELPRKLEADLHELAAKELAGIEHEEAVLSGYPASVISERAEALGADLVCMATHGWTGFQRLLIGSVAERVVRESPCPSLTVRPPEPASPE